MTGSYVGKPSGGKLLRLGLDWEERAGRLVATRVSIRGDFFAHPEEGFDAAEASLAGAELSRLGAGFAAALAAAGVELFGLSPGDLDVACADILARSGEARP